MLYFEAEILDAVILIIVILDVTFPVLFLDVYTSNYIVLLM